MEKILVEKWKEMTGGKEVAKTKNQDQEKYVEAK